MANTKISALSAGSAVTATDILPNVQSAGAGPVQTTAAQIKTFTSASPTLVTPTLGVATGTSLALGAGSAVTSTGAGGALGALSFVTPGTGIGTALAVNVGSAGAPVLFNGDLGTPSSGTLTNATGLPIATGVSNLGTGVATFLGTPSSANLASAVTDETGTGALVFANTPTLVTPVLGVATGTSLALGGATIGTNKLAITGTASFDTGATNKILIGADASFSTATALSMNGILSDTALSGLIADGSHLYINSQTEIVFRPNSTGSNSFIRMNSTSGMLIGSSYGIAWSPNSVLVSPDLFLTRAAIATLQHGAADVSSGAVAQTVTFQGNTGATTTGPLALIRGAGGGSGAGSIGGELRFSGGLSSAAAGTGGAITFYTAPSGAGNAGVLALTIDSTKLATFAGNVSGPVNWTVGTASNASILFSSSNLINLYYLGANLGATVNSGGLMLPNTKGFYWNTFSSLASPADGQLSVTKNNGTTGIGLDFVTADILKVRNVAQNAYATVDALGYKASGAAGVTAGPFTTITSITVTGGIITSLTGS